jgi:hypothetical protein
VSTIEKTQVSTHAATLVTRMSFDPWAMDNFGVRPETGRTRCFSPVIVARRTPACAADWRSAAFSRCYPLLLNAASLA